MKLKKVLASILALCMVLSTMGTVAFANDTVDTWDGTVDTSWYDATATEVTIETAEQLAGLAELVSDDVTFNGVTIKLAKDLDLYCEDTTDAADGDPLTFRPIGDHSKNGTFEGIFDGDGHTISNLYQNGWDLGYQWGVYGSYGLFGNVNDATIKNLTITGSESYIEGGDVSCIAGSATGTCLFENIVIEDSVAATYNNGCGTIIGWSGDGDYTFSNITIADTVTLAGLWGSFDSSIGGVIGQAEPGASYTFNNVNVACRLDAYNDVTASYDYYNYRMSGMLIGRLEETISVDGNNYPDLSKYTIVCNDVNVTLGEWANYHYCRAEGARGVRVEAGYSYDGIAEDYDHSVCTAHHMECIPFTAIFGGDQYAVKGADEKVLGKLPGNEDIVSGLEVTDLAYEARTAVELYVPENVSRTAQLILVDAFGSLEEALASIGTTEGEYIFKVIKDIEEDVVIKQNPDQKITITGDEDNKPVISGTIKIDGQSAAYATAGLTIENLVFDASAITGDTIITAGWDNNTRYISNLTVSNCDFVDETAAKAVRAIASSTGGSKNWNINNCTATGLHSLLQTKNVEDGFVVEDCVITNCKNGININSTENFTMTGTTMTVDGYGVRSGENGTPDITLAFADNTINAGESAIVLRAGTENADVTITSGTYNGGVGQDAVSVLTNATVEISGGSYSSNVDAYLVDGFELTRTGNGYTVVEDTTVDDEGRDQADSISIEYKDITAADAEGEKVYEVVVKANDGDMINELASVDISFAFATTPIEDGNVAITVLPATDFAMSRYENTDRYMFNYNGTTAFEGTDNAITVATITVEGYGAYTIATAVADTNVVNATTLYDNLVDSYTAAGAIDEDTTTGGLVINKDTVADDGLVGKVENDVIAVPVRNLAVTIDFPNAITDNVIAYQDMKVVISGGDLAEDITVDLGSDAAETAIVIDGKVDAKYAVAMVDGSYVINVTDVLTLNNAYTVTVSGAGYRTARYTVTMTEDKALRFWNNVMDEAQVVEIGKDSSAVNVTFLAGDIVKDNKINIYDLSAVVSYFGTETDTTAYDAYAKYDLNRDGVIDSKDVAYVLVSWNN